MDRSISIIIPTYNGAWCVREAVESVFAQTMMPGEIVVVDDCSRDDTLAVVQSLAAHAPLPVRTVKLPANSGGPARPTNVGIREAGGELIAVLDQDDVYAPDVFELAVPALVESPTCSLAFHWAGRYENRHAKPFVPESLQQRLMNGGKCRGSSWEIPGRHLLTCLIQDGNFVKGFPGFIFRRSAWQAKGGLDEKLRIAADIDLLMWLFQHGDGLLVPIVGYWRRVHGANATEDTLQMSLETAVVTARLLATQPDLDADVIEQARQRLEMVAYWFREGQCYREAAQVYRLRADLGQPPGKLALSLIKLNCHRLLASLLGRKPVETCLTRRGGCGEKREAEAVSAIAKPHEASSCI